ncbi:MAG: sensor histidine kinase [Cellulosimicrobium cellulans]
MSRRTRRAGLTVRTRMLAAFLGLSALALLLAGGAAWFLQRGQIDDRIDESLARSANELKRLAGSGVNPVTGEPFTSPEDVVVASIQLTVPAQNEGVLGLREGRTPLVSQQEVRLRLEDDPELVAALSPLVAGDDVVLRSPRTATADYRALVAPVRSVGGTGAPAGQAPAALVLAYDRSAEHAEFAQVFRTYAVVALGALVLIGVVGWVVAGRLLQPIRTLSRTAQDIGETDLSARIPVTGNDDLSDLSRTVNGMLDRLEGAFDSQRRLIDDVGHELRTPLTVVRGHLELMDPHDASDASETRDLALDELDRMNRLVDDLVTLATAGRPDFVRPVDTDLGRLLDDVHDKVRTLGDRRWLVDARADVAVRADAQRLTQALLQLAANAVKFSAPGSVVALGSAVSDDGARVRVWVRDEGVGIAPEQQARIFERFAQATTPGAAHPEGAGLGLAIVAAIAEGHGGRVHVASTPGVGSTFTLDLPLVPVAAAPRDQVEAPSDVHDAAPGRPSAPTRVAPTAPTVPSAPSAVTPALPPPPPRASGPAPGTPPAVGPDAQQPPTHPTPDGRTTR